MPVNKPVGDNVRISAVRKSTQCNTAWTKRSALFVTLAGALSLMPSAVVPQEFVYDEFKKRPDGSGYYHEKGPYKWWTLSPDWLHCKDIETTQRGGSQSPAYFNFTESNTVSWGERVPGLSARTANPSTRFSYSSMPLKMTRDQHTVEVVASGDNTLTINGTHAVGNVTSYRLMQFHFHHPSEHFKPRQRSDPLDQYYDVRKHKFDMELHLVHKDDVSGELAVLAVFIKADGATDNPALEPIFANLANLEIGKEKEFNLTINPDDLVRELRDNAYIRYRGSKTTPPCSPGVNWTLMGGALSISPRQFTAYKLTFPDPNARPSRPPGDWMVVNSPTLGSNWGFYLYSGFVPLQPWVFLPE